MITNILLLILLVMFVFGIGGMLTIISMALDSENQVNNSENINPEEVHHLIDIHRWDDKCNPYGLTL